MGEARGLHLTTIGSKQCEKQGGRNGEGGFHGLFYETVRHQLVFLGFAEIK